MEYYYVQKGEVSGNKLTIKGEEAGHLIRVLRKKIGDEIFVTDGERNLYKSTIIRAGKEIECEIIEKSYSVAEPELKVTLFQALLKNPTRFEFIIEKATELGVYEIIPIITENVVAVRNRQERWQSIALSAMKQSQRCYLPKVSEPLEFREAIKSAESNELKLLAHEKDGTPIREEIQDLPNTKSGCLLVGPEGGFTGDEVRKARGAGFRVVKLGRRKLRSETAAIVILCTLIYQ
jgi:16S rRNA (uracil1498-N3)-methyltransferase